MINSRRFWFFLANLIALASIWGFGLQDNIWTAIIAVLIPNVICYALIAWVEKKHGFFSLQHKFIMIYNLTPEGFELTQGKKDRVIRWEEVTLVKTDKKYKNLHIIHKGQKIKIPNRAFNWYVLLQSIPKNMNGFDFNATESFFASLKPCEVCGNIAQTEKECLACGSPKYNEAVHIDFASKTEFIRSQQFSVFAVMERSEKFEGFYLEADGFERNNEWRPSINEKELLAHSKKEYWDQA